MTSDRVSSEGISDASGTSGVATRLPSASATRTYSPWPPSTRMPSESSLPNQAPRSHDVWTPLRQCAQVPSLSANGEMTKSPGFTVRTSEPTSSTTPTSSCPIRCGEVVGRTPRSEEHTSELQSHSDLVCRLLLEKKKKKQK